MNKNTMPFDLASGRSFDTFINEGSSETADFLRNRVQGLQLSDFFTAALKEFAPTTLVVFADIGCPDCMAVLPYLEKIGEINPRISVVFGDWNTASEAFLQEHLGTGRVPTILALSTSGDLMDGAFIERPLAVHRATAEAASRRDAMIAIGKFRNGGSNDLIEEDLLKVLRGEKNDVLPYLR